MPASAIEAYDSTGCPLRVLVVVSAPIDEMSKVDSQRELQEIHRQLIFSRTPVAFIRLNPPTWRYLYNTLHARSFDVVHFIGHSREDALQLESEDGTARWIAADDLSSLFHATGVKIVILNNCNSEAIGDSLVAKGVPAVVATSGRIRSSVAVSVAASLYTILSTGKSVEKAVETARQFLTLEGEKGSSLVVALGPGSDEVLVESSIQAGQPEFHSCLPIHNLPPNVRDNIFDRVDEVSALYRRMSEHSSPFAGISGIAGSGKSVIAIASARKFAWRFPRGIAYASLRRMRPFDLVSLFSHLDWDLDEIPADKVLKTAAYEMSKGHFLLVLDDLEVINDEEAREIAELLEAWDTSLGGRAILATRTRRPEFDRVVQSNWISVGEFPMEASLQLLYEQIGGEDAAKTLLGEENIENVPVLCHNHPKLITLIAAATQLGVSWDDLRFQLRTLSGRRIEQMTQILDTTISQLEKETPIAGQLLDCWSVFAEAATTDAWRYIYTGRVISRQDPLWELLQDAFIVMQRADILHRFDSESGGENCRMHPLISEFIRTHRWDGLSNEKQRQYHKRHLSFLSLQAEARPNDFQIAGEWDNVLLALDHAKQYEDWDGILQFANVTVGGALPALLSAGRHLYKYALVILDYAIEASVNLSDTSRNAKFQYLKGICQYRLAEFRDALLSWSSAVDLAKRLSDDSLLWDATIELGRGYYRITEYEKAEECFAATLSGVPEGDVQRQSRCLHELGRLEYRQGDLERAKLRLLEALDIRREQSDTLGVAMTSHELARVFHKNGEYELARSTYLESLQLRRIASDLIGQQATLHQLGLLAYDQGDYDTARRYYDECDELSRALNDRFWIAHNDYRYARLLWRLGERSRARDLARGSLELSNLLGISLIHNVESWLSTHTL